jgi:hypothetical protein
MNTVSKMPARDRRAFSPETDPWYHGYRYAQVLASDSFATFEQVPLTLHGVLFPQEGDYVVHIEGHLVDVIYLRTVFKARLESNQISVPM